MNHRECCGSYDEVIGIPEFKEVDFLCRMMILFAVQSICLARVKKITFNNYRA